MYWHVQIHQAHSDGTVNEKLRCNDENRIRGKKAVIVFACNHENAF